MCKYSLKNFYFTDSNYLPKALSAVGLSILLSECSCSLDFAKTINAGNVSTHNNEFGTNAYHLD